jgi:hypothetical protein
MPRRVMPYQAVRCSVGAQSWPQADARAATNIAAQIASREEVASVNISIMSFLFRITRYCLISQRRVVTTVRLNRF